MNQREYHIYKHTNMNELKTSIIGQLVAEHPDVAKVFSNYQIDFCCQGNRPLSEVLTPENERQLLAELQAAMQSEQQTTMDFRDWPLDLLVDYIVKKHHRYVEERSQEIKAYLAKIVAVHGAKHPELIELERLFLQSAGDLAVHMKKEELVLFPYIQRMLGKKEATHGFVEHPIAAMHDDHNQEGERFRAMSALTNGYRAPADACTTYLLTFQRLAEFERDLHMHIHLENNILFPRALALETSLRN